MLLLPSLTHELNSYLLMGLVHCSWGLACCLFEPDFPICLLKSHLPPCLSSVWFLWCHHSHVGGYLPALWLACVYHGPTAKLINVLIAQILTTSLIVTFWEWLAWCLLYKCPQRVTGISKFLSVAAQDSTKQVTMGWNELGHALSWLFQAVSMHVLVLWNSILRAKSLRANTPHFLPPPQRKKKHPKLLLIS